MVSGFAALDERHQTGGAERLAQREPRAQRHGLAVILDFWNTVNTELKTIGIPQTPAAPASRWRIRTASRSCAGWSPTCRSSRREYIELSKNLGVGLSVLGGWRWLSGNTDGNGPPFRTILDSGARAGMSSDGMQIAVMDPWTGMYYAVTGKNARGVLINGGQTITREQVLRLYTADNAWFLGPKWERNSARSRGASGPTSWC